MKRFLLGVLGFAFVACHGGGADPNHNGAKLAARVVCEDVAMATCDKAEACGAAQPPGGGNCFDTFMAACCTGAACDQQTPDTQQQVDACTNDIAHGSCADLANNFPKSCTSL